MTIYTIVPYTGYKVLSYGLAIAVFIVTLLHLLVPLILVLSHQKHRSLKKMLFPIVPNLDLYLRSAVFFLAMLLSILIIATNASNGCCVAGAWHVGLFAIILGWIYLIVLSSKLPIIGEQAIVFQDIILTFLKLAPFALLLVLAATIVLTITFFDAQALVS